MEKKVICHDRQEQEHLVAYQDLRWRPSVYGFLIEGNRVLLSPQWDGYDFPGGGVNINESLEEALVREFKEETGLDISVGQTIYASSSFYYLENPDEGQHWNCPIIYFLVSRQGGELSLNYAEEYEKEYMKEPVWIEIDKLSELTFYNGLKGKNQFLVELAKKIKENI